MTLLHLSGQTGIPYRQLTRHIGIFGATGTGKTSTAMTLLNRLPCPAIVIDAKGDLEQFGNSCIAPALRIDRLSAAFLSMALELSPAQAGTMAIALAYAEDNGIAIVDLSDLRAMLSELLDNAESVSRDYGLISKQSVAAIQRVILPLERRFNHVFTDNPPDLRTASGITVIQCRDIVESPALYAAFVASVADSLYSGFGEIGDVGKPGLALMVDEAHLLFDCANTAVTRRLEQVTRLIRSKGVSLIYVTQSPADLPDAIMAQLGSRIQHGLRGSTPKQVSAIQSAASVMGTSMADLTNLGIGEAFIAVSGQRATKVKIDYLPELPTGSLDLIRLPDWRASLPPPLPVEAQDGDGTGDEPAKPTKSLGGLIFEALTFWRIMGVALLGYGMILAAG